jgi:D-alanyl-D-alanine carboxypeptidase/D-alanyl-D-alanine-endopeptidase (penicillin-binding protein 4)
VLARSTWGIVIRSATHRDTLYTLNEGKLLMPGSAMKIVTLAAAAERLGWDYVYETRLIAGGPIDAQTGVLDGDLFIEGSGDPSIVTDAGMTTGFFPAWADTLKARGVRTVTGRVVGNDNAFDDEALGPGWAWDDLAGRDATAVSALQYNENVVIATIAPGNAVGAPAVVTVAPSGSTLVVDNRLTTTAPALPAAITLRRSPGSDRIELRGSVPIGGGPFIRPVSVDNPTMFFAGAFRDALTAAGIEVRGPAADIDDLVDRPSPENWTVLATHQSPPLSGLAVRLMKNSQNLYAETLMKTLGATSGSPSFESGRIVATAALLPWGVDPSGLVQVDGSGLSRYNYATADTLADVLMRVHEDPRLRAPFAASLPIAGVDGTLAARMKGTAAEGKARAKSGTLANVRSLAGYVTTPDGEPLVFAVIANNFGRMPESAIAAIDAIVARLAEFRR